MDEEKIGKQKKTFVITLIILLLVTIILYFISNNMGNNNKNLSGQDYIIEEETEYSEKGLLPKINLTGEEIDDVNKQIIEEYYSIAYTDFDTFEYEYSIYNDILSLHILTTRVDNSEYGTIKNMTYNIDVEKNKVLSNTELIKQLGLNQKTIETKIEERLKNYYSLDSLNKYLDYNSYLEQIGYNEKNNSFFIRDKKLYYYMPINVTQSLISYQGNIYEIEILKLEK